MNEVVTDTGFPCIPTIKKIEGGVREGLQPHLFNIMAEGGCLFEGGPLLEHGCFFKKKTDLEVLMII